MNHKQKAKDIAAGIYITQASLANAIETALNEAYKQGVTATDDQSLDCTDDAHPAWWRGNDQGCLRTAERLQKALDGLDDGSGVISSPEIEKARRDILHLKCELAAEKAGYPHEQPLTDEPLNRQIVLLNRRVIELEAERDDLKSQLQAEKARHSCQHAEGEKERDQLKAELERVTREFQRAKERALIHHLQAICEKCGGHKVNDLCVDCQLDQIDLMRDEFTRIKALTLSAEIAGLCDRAITQTEQNTPVLVRLDDTERERDTARRQLREALTLLNKSTSALQHSCDCNQTPLACVCLVGEICEFLARQKGETK